MATTIPKDCTIIDNECLKRIKDYYRKDFTIINLSSIRREEIYRNEWFISWFDIKPSYFNSKEFKEPLQLFFDEVLMHIDLFKFFAIYYVKDIRKWIMDYLSKTKKRLY